MNPTEILEHFRSLSFAEQCKAIQLIHAEFGNELGAEQMAKYEQMVKKIRRHPENGINWERVRAELKERLGNRPTSPAK